MEGKGGWEGQGGEEENIMDLLFYHDLYEPLRIVFLSLDSISLKRARCVCQSWNTFIGRSIWGSRSGRRRLLARLGEQWRSGQVRERRIDTGNSGVNFLAADNRLVVCGYTRGATARVFSLPSGSLLYSLACAPPGRLQHWPQEPVQLDLGDEVIATVVDEEHGMYGAMFGGESRGGDVVSVWDRRAGELLYQGRPYGEGVSVMGLAVQEGGGVLAGGGDGRVCRIGPGCTTGPAGQEGWGVRGFLEGCKQEVTHLDSRDKWAVTGSRTEARLWDLEAGRLVEEVRPVPVKVWMLCLSYPHVFIVGGEDWDGLQVWHLPEHRLVRWLLQDFPLHNIHLSGNLLTVSELRGDGEPENKECLAVVLDVREVVTESVAIKSLWSKRFSFNPGEGNRQLDQINAVTNSTCLIVSHDTYISVFDFWNEDREEALQLESVKPSTVLLNSLLNMF